MFKKARLKLTGWYLLIIMTISFSFSAFIYRSVTAEFQRRLTVIERRLELRENGFAPPPGAVEFFVHDLIEAKHKVLFVLLYTNGVIFIFSAAAGYWLAGKTLRPIEEVLEEQKRFVADASHELKTPITSLQTTIEVALREKKLSLNEAKKILKENLEETEKLKKLTGTLLALARMQQNGNSIPKEIFSINEVVNESAKEMKKFAKTKRVKIRLKKQTKKYKVAGQQESIKRMMVALLDNAIKYSKRHGVVVVTVGESKKNVTIRITDKGQGIAKKDMPHIFERFYRAEVSRSKKNIDGFGLGLSLVKRVLEVHEGKISVKSKLGEGTSITIKLPKA